MSNQDEGRCGVGDILQAFKTLREKVGNLKAKKKDGVKFKVRSAEELSDKLRKAEDAAGVISYPVLAGGNGYPVEDGTLASVCLTIRVKALSDGSYIDIAGFGLGADTQDKAGGKAMTYGWKAAFIQALQAGGADDTDDTDTPIQGGVKKKGAGKPTVQSVKDALADLKSPADVPRFRDVAMLGSKLSPDQQNELMDEFASARERLGMPKRPAASPSATAQQPTAS